ncbi:hypothetical protein ACQF1Z_004458 [Escherichia coli]|nr:hypothetical protein [Escherichia coli]EET7199851.1 hypothetical protein [Escherichia coli]EET7254173.1 hypothetical protein [Escherichia coli]EFC9735417.1 hypothetical protein [Escherichia coli]EFN4539150.1 hypothetical protein [Escherichia coli]
MRKDIIARALPVLGDLIELYQRMAEEQLAIYQLHGEKWRGEYAAEHQHKANVLAELANDLAEEMDRQHHQ